MYVGNESTSNAYCTDPEISRYSVQLMRFCSTNAFNVLSSPSALMPTISNALSAYFLCSACIVGKDSRHGGHHVAQKSSSTTFPRIAVFETCVPSIDVKPKFGANGSRARIGAAP